MNLIANPRIGLRRRIFTRTRSQHGRTDRLHVELHHGGEAVLACAVLDDEHTHGLIDPGYGALRVTRLESAVVDSMALTVASARDRGCVGMISIKVAVAFTDNARRDWMSIRVTRWT